METPAVQRRTMQAVKSKDTAPELFVRSLLHAQGYRYRLHRKDLPGRPDLVFPGRRKVIFIHGCFWHGHSCRRGARVPKSNASYWAAKIARNRARDEGTQASLKQHGWQVFVIWECELKNVGAAMIGAQRFLGPVGDLQLKMARRPQFIDNPSDVRRFAPLARGLCLSSLGAYFAKPRLVA